MIEVGKGTRPMNAATCPVCEKTMSEDEFRANKYRPFCSERCRDIDLGRWLGESYRLPAEEPPDDLTELDDLDDPNRAF